VHEHVNVYVDEKRDRCRARARGRRRFWGIWLRSGPFEGPATIKPPAPPEDIYVCRACATARKWKSSPNLMEVKGSGAQEHQCKTVFEGSAEQTRERMNKEPDMRHERRTSERMIAKSISIKGASCKSGLCARKAGALTSGDLPYVTDS
jgi:hypothetical protein